MTADSLTEDERWTLGCHCTRLDDEWHHRRFCPAPAVERIVAQRTAAAKAEALREAASDIVADCSNQPGPCICTARHWLNDRADRLAAERES